ncbi:MAG: hypothetical protein ACFB0C_20290 [Leptolyngbyaceae cyanobacterium]
MSKRIQNQAQNPEIIDAEFTAIETGAALIPQQQAVNLRPRNTPRSNIKDGGYFDAAGKRRPIFLILPSDDQMAALMAIRAWLSAVRHKPFQTVGVTGATFWFGFAGLSGGLNLLRGDVVQCSGDAWNPVVTGCNVAAAISGPSQGLAGNLHDVVLGQDDFNEEIETRPKIRAVRVEE